MKGNNIDELFRQKLEHQKIAPPANAWEKVESNLEGKKKGVYFWLSIAASALVICTLAGLFLSQPKKPTSNDQLQANSVKEEPVEVDKEEPQQTQTTAQQEADKGRQQEEAAAPIKQLSSPPQLIAKLDSKPTKLNPVQNIVVRQNVKTVSIQKIDININLSINTMASFKSESVMPITLTDYYGSTFVESEVEASKKKRFSLMDGIISIAKGVNTAKETISDLRSAKNEFVTNELKYGSTESETDTKAPANNNTTNSQFE